MAALRLNYDYYDVDALLAQEEVRLMQIQNKLDSLTYLLVESPYSI